MARYSVAAWIQVNIEVEAESPEQAREIAQEGRDGDIVDVEGADVLVHDDACVALAPD